MTPCVDVVREGGEGRVQAVPCPIAVLTALTCAPITRTIRGIRSEVEVGPEQGLPDASVITCDSIITIPKGSFDEVRIGHLDVRSRADLDRALRYSLDIRY